MTRKEYLKERYEDAIFAVLMDEVATQEGYKAIAENTHLCNTPQAQVPLKIHDRNLKTIRNYFSKQRKKTMRLSFRHIFSRIAVAIIIIILTLATAFASSENLRNKTLNWIIETFNEGTLIQANPSDNSDINGLAATWLPDGFILFQQISDSHGSHIKYINPINGANISISRIQMDGMAILTNTEDIEVTNTLIQGYDAMIIERDPVSQIIILYDSTTVIQLESQIVNLDDLLKVAHNLIIS